MSTKGQAGSIAARLSPRSEQREILPSVILPQTHGPRPVMVDTPQGQRWAGVIEGKVLKKKVIGSRHLMRSLDAWGFQVEAIEEAQKSGITMIEVEDTERGTIYSVSLGLFLKKGIQKDFGHGVQVFLPRRCWKRKSTNQLALVLGGGDV